jgi:hypothetical protein
MIDELPAHLRGARPRSRLPDKSRIYGTCKRLIKLRLQTRLGAHAFALVAGADQALLVAVEPNRDRQLPASSQGEARRSGDEVHAGASGRCELRAERFS